MITDDAKPGSFNVLHLAYLAYLAYLKSSQVEFIHAIRDGHVLSLVKGHVGSLKMN